MRLTRGFAVLLGVVLATSSLRAAGPLAVSGPTVEITPGGQFYHRPGHLTGSEQLSVAVGTAVVDGYTPCPECQPDKPGETPQAVSAYYRTLLIQRSAGLSYQGLKAVNQTLTQAGNQAGNQAGGAVAGPDRSARAPGPAAEPRARPEATIAGYGASDAATGIAELPADGIAVPGTGGLLKVPTFKGSNGIVAIPLPMGGYRVVEPTLTGPGVPQAADPSPSAR